MNKGQGNISFHRGLDSKEGLQIVYGEIMSINHKTLGLINEIDCEGLTYKIVLASGQDIHIEAEEGPGKIDKDSSSFQEDFDTDEFQFQVTIQME